MRSRSTRGGRVESHGSIRRFELNEQHSKKENSQQAEDGGADERDRGSSQQGRSHQKRCKWEAEHRDERQDAEIAAAPDLHPKIGLLRIVDQIGVAPAKSPWIGRREDPTISYTLEQSLFDSFWHQHGQSPYDEAGHMLRPERETPLFRARHGAAQSPRNTS